MALTIDLAPEEETLLGEQAAQQGQETAIYAAQMLRQLIFALPAPPEPPQGQTLAEALAGYIGVVDSRELNGGRMSDFARNSEEEFGKIMDEKKRQGHA
jgi:hypothetical protein